MITKVAKQKLWGLENLDLKAKTKIKAKIK